MSRLQEVVGGVGLACCNQAIEADAKLDAGGEGGEAEGFGFLFVGVG